MTDHALGGKIINRIRMRTPIAKLREGDIPSPSRLESDQMILPNMTIKGEILNMPTVESTSPEKKTVIKSSNPYSIDNIPLVKDEKPVKLKKIYTVKSKQEMQKYNEEKFKMYNQKQNAFSINRLRSKGPKQFDYLTGFKEERERKMAHKNQKIDMREILKKSQAKKEAKHNARIIFKEQNRELPLQQEVQKLKEDLDYII